MKLFEDAPQRVHVTGRVSIFGNPSDRPKDVGNEPPAVPGVRGA